MAQRVRKYPHQLECHRLGRLPEVAPLDRATLAEAFAAGFDVDRFR